MNSVWNASIPSQNIQRWDVSMPMIWDRRYTAIGNKNCATATDANRRAAKPSFYHDPCNRILSSILRGKHQGTGESGDRAI